MGQIFDRTTRRSPRGAHVCAATTMMLCVGATASAGSVFTPIPSDYNSNLRMLVDLSMRATYGPVSGEGDGMHRYEGGLYPPETIELGLPELRSASPLAALQWSNRWRELIVAAFGGQREMINYWEQGATEQGDIGFSVLSIGNDLLQSDGRRRTVVNERIESISQPSVGRALAFATGGASGGGGSGGGGIPALEPLTSADNSAPLVPTESIPAVPGTSSPTVDAPEPPTNSGPEQIPGLALNLGNIEWVNPNFNQSPPPPLPENGEGGFVDSGPTAAVAIPTPTAVGLGAAGLLALGARMRRRGLI